MSKKRHFTDDEVRAIRIVYRPGKAPTLKQIAEYYGVSDVAIFKIVHWEAYAKVRSCNAWA